MRRVWVQRKHHNVLDLLLAFVLLLLLVGILLAEVTRSAAAVSLERAVLTTFTVTEEHVGYLFCDEEVLSTTNNGPVQYAVAEGELVGAGSTVANVYTDGTGRDKRGEAAALYAEIDALEKALTEQEAAWQTAYLSSWGDAMAALSAGNWRGGASGAAALTDALVQRDVAQGGDENRDRIKARIAELTAAAEELVRYEQMLPVRASTEGVFTTAVDGLESIFGKGSVEDLTPEGLQEKLRVTPADADVIGKLIGTGEFYMAVPLSRREAESYAVGDTYCVRFIRCGEAIDMTLSRIAISEKGEEALLILRGEQLPPSMDFSRRQTLEIVRESMEGLALPLSALQSDGEREVVYIESEGNAVARAVTVLYRGNGVLLIAPNEGEGYLAEGDAVLVTERTLYEGRVIR